MAESGKDDRKMSEKCSFELTEKFDELNSEIVNNNSKFHTTGISQKKYVFPKRARIDLQFEDVRYQVKEWTLKNPLPVNKKILHGVSGEFLAGELTAIMGPSGAGKSTLLNILAAFTLRGSSGSVKVNHEDRATKDTQEFRRLSCYIQQDDHLRMELKVSEAMMYTIDLKTGSSISKERKQQQMKDILEMLGLDQCLETPTGSLSGGQKKRLSIALELISNPPIIFLDEPTTGLDSSSCSQCVSLLKFLAQQGRTVVCTIHQPSALLFEMFDHLYALSAGRCIYSDTVRNLVPHLASLDLVCPQYHNPADFLLDVAIGEYGADLEVLVAAAKSKYARTNVTEKNDFEGNDYLVGKTLENGINNNEYSEIADEPMPDQSKIRPASMIHQFWLLFCRKLLCTVRKPSNVLVRLFAHLFIAFLFGYIYRDMGVKASTVLANYCYIYGSNLFVVYTGKMSVTLLFPIELWTVSREHFNRWYKLAPYYISMMLVEIPFQIICCYLYLPLSYYLTGQPMEWERFWYYSIIATASSLTAQAFGFLLGVVTPRKIAVFLGPVIACLLSVFGFCLRYADTPHYLRWMYHISYFRAAFQSSVYSMYGLNRTTLYCGEEEFYCHFKNPKKFLSEMDMPNDISMEFNFVFILCWGIILHILTVIVIWFKLNRK